MILNKALAWITGVSSVLLVLSALYTWKLRGDVNALAEDKVELQAQAASLKASISALQDQALKSTKTDIKQSTTRTTQSKKLKAVQVQVLKEAEHDPIETVVPTANPVQLDRLRRLVHEANAGIRAAGADSN